MQQASITLQNMWITVFPRIQAGP